MLRHVCPPRHQILALSRPAFEVVVAGRGIVDIVGSADAVFPDKACPISRLAQAHRIAELVLLLAQPRPETVNAVTARVPAREERSSGGGADGGGHVVVREHHALVREPVHVRRPNDRIPAGPEHVVALVVREQEQDIGGAIRAGARPAAQPDGGRAA